MCDIREIISKPTSQTRYKRQIDRLASQKYYFKNIEEAVEESINKEK